MKKHVQLSLLEERLREKEQQIQILQAEAALLKSVIDEALGRKPEMVVKSRARRSNVKDAVLTLLQDVKSEGLNATLAVELAAAKTLELDRGTVSSLLSRLKNDGVVTYDGRVYRLKEFAPQQAPSASQDGWPANNVVAHPASKVQS